MTNQSLNDIPVINKLLNGTSVINQLLHGTPVINTLLSCSSVINKLLNGISVFNQLLNGNPVAKQVTLLRDRLYWLRVPQRIYLKRCLLVHKALHRLAPTYIAEYCVNTKERLQILDRPYTTVSWFHDRPRVSDLENVLFQ